MFLRANLGRAWLPVVFWMAAIFIGSTDLLSSAHTSRWVGPILHWLLPSLSQARIDQLQFLIRKCGHLTEYAILAMFVWRALHLTTGIPYRSWNGRLVAASIAVAALYAASDEFHQSFVPTRYPSVVDVLIDTTGAAVGTTVLAFALRSPAALSVGSDHEL